MKSVRLESADISLPDGGTLYFEAEPFRPVGAYDPDLARMGVA